MQYTALATVNPYLLDSRIGPGALLPDQGYSVDGHERRAWLQVITRNV